MQSVSARSSRLQQQQQLERQKDNARSSIRSAAVAVAVETLEGRRLMATDLTLAKTDFAGAGAAFMATEVTAGDGGSAHEVEDLRVVDSAGSEIAAGSFTLSFGGSTTTRLPANATASQVDAALNALPSITTAGGVNVDPRPGNSHYQITFKNNDAQNQIAGQSFSPGPSDVLKYELTYDDVGSTDAVYVRITETVPTGTTFDASDSTPGWVPSGDNYFYDVQELAASDPPASVIFAIRINNPFPTGQTSITNTATIADAGSGDADPTPQDNTASDTDPVDTSNAPVANNSLIVTTTADEDNGSSDPGFGVGTSLREAINYANAHTGSDAITFNLGAGAHTIQLSSALADLSDDVTLTGPGANLLTVNGKGLNSGFRIFTIGVSKTVAISGMTISNGDTVDGGGINNDGSLTLTGVSVSGNRANSGGAIESAGPLTLNNSLVSNNSSGSHGAIDIRSGTSIFTNSTISGNTADSEKEAGGIEVANASLSLTNCTITNNFAGVGGGMFINGSASVTANNSIISGNTAAIADDNVDGLDVLTNSSNNLIDVDPATLKIGALSDNGGATMTHAVLTGSPAVNAGSNALAIDPSNNNAPLVTDQRGAGFPRIVGGTVDIGAFESSIAMPTAQTITLQAEDAAYDSKSKFAKDHSGYHGTGFVNIIPKNGFVQFGFTASTFGPNTKLQFRYANGSSSSRPMDVYVEGVKIGSLSFDKTGSWSKWETDSIALPLSPGAHAVKVVATGSNGGPNLDELSVIPVAPTKPVKPTSLESDVVSKSSIKLKWKDNATNETGYHVLRSTSSSFSTATTVLFTLGANVTTFVDTGLKSNTKYYYKVEAFNDVGGSGYTGSNNETTKKK